jgi:hypothetical protein
LWCSFRGIRYAGDWLTTPSGTNAFDADSFSADPFDTGSVRRRVLGAWAQSTARFREDANAEEELFLGPYRDRVIVELAQNASDAAMRAGEPGRVSMRLLSNTLSVANTGVPWDAAGIESASTLRASTKQGITEAAGRFGVGFAAVLSVTDAPTVVSIDGGVTWSRERALRELSALPNLDEEVGRRAGLVPVLRLPYPVPERAIGGFSSIVTLPLRDAAARDAVRQQLDAVGSWLLLALPGIETLEISVDDRRRMLRIDREAGAVTIADGEASTRWRLVTASGDLDQAMLRDRPLEERERGRWSVCWAVPLTLTGAPAELPLTIRPVFHAPTPVDDPMGLPALLVAGFPLDSGRRRVQPGPLTDALIGRCADAYLALVAEFAADVLLAEVMPLVPSVVGVGELDAALRRAILERLRELPFLRIAVPGEIPVSVSPGDAAVVADPTGATLPLLGGIIPGAVDPGTVRWRAQLISLGAREVSLADVMDALVGVQRPASWWWALYAALDLSSRGWSASEREVLAALPVPLVDGRLVRGPAGVILPGRDVTGGKGLASLAAWGVRVADPEAAHPMLERLGAERMTARTLIASSAVQAAIGSYWDSSPVDAPAGISDLVLELASSAGLVPGELPWLGMLALHAADGELVPAGDLVLPGSLLHRMWEPESVASVSDALVERWGPEVLTAVGVMADWELVRDQEVELTPEVCDHDLAGEREWLAHLAVSGDAVSMVAVRDLELIRPEAWPEMLRLMRERPLSEAVEPMMVRSADGRSLRVPSYTTWWLSEHPVIDGQCPKDLRARDANPLLDGLYDPVPEWADPTIAAACGVRETLGQVLGQSGGVAEVLRRLADASRRVDVDQLSQVYRLLAQCCDPSHDVLAQPVSVRAIQGATTVVVPAHEAVVVDAPQYLPLVAGKPMVLGGPELAALLGLPVASQLTQGIVAGVGVSVSVPEVVHGLLPDGPRHYFEYDRLVVDDREVDWWVSPEDTAVHAATVDGLARGLAIASGNWPRRFLLAAVLSCPDEADRLAAEEAFGDPNGGWADG